MVVRSYIETYGLNAVITNCSNNYGANQHDEKFIPTIIRNALSGNPIPVYGNGKNIRDWLYVEDHVRGIDLVYQTGKKGETYNIGGHNEKQNTQIVSEICKILDLKYPIANNDKIAKKTGSYLDLMAFVKDRAGHDARYAIDSSKISESLGWSAEEDFSSGILKTISWYIEKYVEH